MTDQLESAEDRPTLRRASREARSKLEKLVILLARAEGEAEDLYERQAREFITLNLHQSENVLPLERRKADLLMELHELVNKGEKQGNLWRLRNWRQLRAWKKQIARGEATAALQLQASHLEELRLANRLAFVSAREAHRYAAALNRATRLLAIVTAGMIFIGAVQLVTNVVL